MKNWLVGTVLLVMLVVIATSCGGEAKGYDTPEETVHSFLGAFESMDIDGIFDCVSLDTEGNEEIRELVEWWKTQGMSPSYTNISLVVAYPTKDTATVDVSYESCLSFNGEFPTEIVEMTLTLEKKNGKWLITGESEEWDAPGGTE